MSQFMMQTEKTISQRIEGAPRWPLSFLSSTSDTSEDMLTLMSGVESAAG